MKLAEILADATGFRSPMKTIAVDLDDTLNNFTETLRRTEFNHDGTYSFSKEVFDGYLERMRSGSGDDGELLSTEYSFLKLKIHHRCYDLAKARPDGVAFMQWLKANHWRIVICTYRDLRRANAATKRWLLDHGIPFDHLFMAWNKIVFCKTWGIEHLVDDHAFNSTHGKRYSVNVYFPLKDGLESMAEHGARGFKSFDEVRQWIQG